MFQPVVPFGGFLGWSFLQRTLDDQKEAHSESAPVRRATDAFREDIGAILNAEQLMENRDLLRVALGAFGLENDINNKALIRQVLEGGTLDPASLANRLSDPRYAQIAEAFGFGDFDVPNTQLSTFASDIIARFESRSFDRAVGDSNEDMRLSLNVAPALQDVLDAQKSKNGQWFAMMGNAPLRRVFETGLGLPTGFGSIDIDRQLDEFKQRASQIFGTDDLSEIASEENQEKLIRLFLVRSESQAPVTSPALALLQAGQFGSFG